MPRRPRPRCQQDEPTPPTPPMQAMSIPQFCQSHGFSEAFYFKLKKQGLTPVEMHLGQRVLISMESARAWRAARENAASGNTAAA